MFLLGPFCHLAQMTFFAAIMDVVLHVLPMTVQPNCLFGACFTRMTRVSMVPVDSFLLKTFWNDCFAIVSHQLM